MANNNKILDNIDEEIFSSNPFNHLFFDFFSSTFLFVLMITKNFNSNPSPFLKYNFL